MGEELSHTDIKHRRLSSLTPDEYQTVVALLSLLGAELQGYDDGREHLHLTLNVPTGIFRQNALRVPTTCTIDELIGWARLLNKYPES